MAKFNPVSTDGPDALRMTRSDKEWAKELNEQVNADKNALGPWFQKKADFYKRRYGLSGRDVSFPWKNASDIVVPMSDIHIEETKVPVFTSIFGGRRIVDMHPLTDDAVPHSHNATVAMEDLLRYRMPDYMLQTAYSLDSWAQHGVSFDKVYYSYITHEGVEAIKRADLPRSLASLVVMDDVTDMARQQAQEQFGVMLLTKDEFNANGDDIRLVISNEYGLDEEDKLDKKAMDDIFVFLRDAKGDDHLNVMVRQVIEDTPRVVNLSVHEVVTNHGARSIQEANRVSVEFFLGEEEMRQRARDNGWSKESVDWVLTNAKIADAGQMGPNFEYLLQARRQRSSTLSNYASGTSEAVWHLREVYAYKIRGNGNLTRRVITMEALSGRVLHSAEYPFAHGQWPIVETMFEPNEYDMRASRGLPQKMADPDRAVTAMTRGLLNGLSIETAKTFTYRVGSGINPAKLRWRPGLMIPVNRPDDLQPVETSVTSLALERPIMQMQALAERISGGFNPGALQDEKLLEPRTATEVRARSSSRQATLGWRAQIFHEGRERIYRQVWALWKQFGPKDFFVRSSGETPVKMSQEQIRGSFRIVARAAVAEMDPQFRMEQAMMKLQILTQAAPMLAQHPLYVPDLGQAVKDVLDEIDPEGSRRILRRRSPEEQQQFMQQQQMEAQRMSQLQQTAEALQANAPVTEEEAAEVLDAVRKEVAPHKNLQKLRQAAQASQGQATLNQSITNGQMG